MIEIEPRPEIPSLKTRITRRVDRLLHPISTEAEDHFADIRALVEGTKLDDELSVVDDNLRSMLAVQDRRAVVSSLVTRAIGFFVIGDYVRNVGFINVSSKSWGHRLMGAAEAGVGTGIMAYNVLNPDVGMRGWRDQMRTDSAYLKVFYGTEEGRKAAEGEDGYLLSPQVDLIIDTISAGTVPTFSAAAAGLPKA